MDTQIVDAIEKAVQKAFSAEGGDKRYIDVSRVPLICQAIVGIRDDIKDINQKLDDKFVSKTEFIPVKTLAFGFVGLVLIAVVGALVGLVIIRP